MRYLIIIFSFIFTVSFLPLDAFCDDNHFETEAQHHCVVACHSCHQALPSGVDFSHSFTEFSSDVFFNYSVNYQDPVLDQSYRPPISSI